jgi:ABC-2 type transport system permease protein
MNKIYRFFIRISAFLGKEIFAILRQPMLVLTLVLGPFLILLLFGIGFQNEPPALRTLFVLSGQNEELAGQIEEYVSSIGPQLIFMGVINDPVEATRRLLRREVDVVALVPADAYEMVRNNQQVVIQLQHNEIDPFQIDYINIFGQVYADEINRRILRRITATGQQESVSVHDSLESTQQRVADLRQAIAAGDNQDVEQRQQDLEQEMGTLALAVGTTLSLADGVNEAIGGNSNSDSEQILGLLENLQENTSSLKDQSSADQPALVEEQSRMEEIETDLNELETMLSEFQNVDPNILVSPFRSEAASISNIALRPSDYFAPSVVVLLLQHLAVTFGALSIVRERRDGTMELFRVSPISAFETLLGKYISYFIFAAVITTILSLITVYGLGVPMLGGWLAYGLSLAVLVFTSLGLGFLISLIATTDTEAVQYSMIALLTSVFFSGALISLNSLWLPVRTLSWLLPATYGVQLLQNIMLRGLSFNPILLGGLLAIGLFLFFIAWYLLGRLMARS